MDALHLVRLADIWANARHVSLWRVGHLAAGRGSYFVDLRGRPGVRPRNTRMDTASRVLRWLSDHWPADATWPADIPRPAPVDEAEKAGPPPPPSAPPASLKHRGNQPPDSRDESGTSGGAASNSQSGGAIASAALPRTPSVQPGADGGAGQLHVPTRAAVRGALLTARGGVAGWARRHRFNAAQVHDVISEWGGRHIDPEAVRSESRLAIARALRHLVSHPGTVLSPSQIHAFFDRLESVKKITCTKVTDSRAAGEAT